MAALMVLLDVMGMMRNVCKLAFWGWMLLCVFGMSLLLIVRIRLFTRMTISAKI